jgi:hypothetical protein
VRQSIKIGFTKKYLQMKKEEVLELVAQGNPEQAIEILLKEDSHTHVWKKLLAFQAGYACLTRENYPEYDDLMEHWVIITHDFIMWVKDNL